MHQTTPAPLRWLADIFDPLSERRAHLLQNGTEPELKGRLQDLGSLSLTARRTETAPAERILRARGHSAGQ